MNQQPRVLVCGSINKDSFVLVDHFPEQGHTVHAEPGPKALGGKGANQAVAVATAKLPVKFVGTIGLDVRGQDVLAELATYNVDISSVRTTSTHPTGVAVIMSNEAGDNIIIVTAGANQVTDPVDFVDAIKTSNLVLGQGEITPAATEKLATLANMHGCRFVLNLAPVPESVSPGLIAAADPLIVDELEAYQVLQALDEAHDLSPEDIPAMMHRLLDYAKSVVITVGPKGCAYQLRNEPGWLQPSVEVTDPVDSTGAGDAFVGTLAAQLARGKSLAEAVLYGNAAGALAVRSIGAAKSFAPWDEVSALAEGQQMPSRVPAGGFRYRQA